MNIYLYSELRKFPPKPVMVAGCLALYLSLLSSVTLAIEQTPLTLAELVDLAVEHDPWLERSRALEQALSSEAIAAGELPDPMVSATLLNFPTDTFKLAQEPMTQIRFGYTQRFPGGDSRDLRRRVKTLQSERLALDQSVRTKTIELQITDLWLDLYLARSSAQLIKIDRPLFEQLIEVTNASYRSATRKVSQQDLIRAQLELTRLDDRLLRLNEIQDSRHKELAEWLPMNLLATPISWQFPDELAVSPVRETEGERLYQLLSRHPELRSSDQSIAATRVGLRLAQEETKPDWALNAAYGYRDEDRFGNELADFVTLGVTFQLPLFKKNRQNQEIAAAADLVSADESGRVARLQQLTRRYLKAYATLDSLDERLDLYQGSLLRQMDALAEASLNAYTTDEGDFADVMRAYVALLNAKIEARTIEVNRLKVLAEIRYIAANPEYAL